MTRVDFYLLPHADKTLFACRLADKAYQNGHAVYVLAPDAAVAQHLDALLWTFSQGSFVPHELHLNHGEAKPTPPCPVLIGHDEPPADHHDILISLWHEVPPFFSRFARLLELVAGDEAEKQRSRERFRFYRDRGYALETHTL